MKVMASLVALLLYGQSIPDRPENAPVMWPKLVEFETSKEFDISVREFRVTLPLLDIEGNTQYFLICVGGNQDYLDILGDQLGVNLVGPLSCRLNFNGTLTGFSLLGSDSRPIWHTRARFHGKELIGECGDYPEFGRVRHFKLRGFELMLRASNVVVQENGWLQSMTLEISVKQNQSIRNSRAAPPGYLEPGGEGRSCDVVIEGDDPEFCRDLETYEQIECTDYD